MTPKRETTEREEGVLTMNMYGLLKYFGGERRNDWLIGLVAIVIAEDGRSGQAGFRIRVLSCHAFSSPDHLQMEKKSERVRQQ